MTSPRRRPGSPVESVWLKVTLKADRKTAARILEAIPSAKLKGGVCVVVIEGEGPTEAAAKAKEVLDRIRSVESGPKGFK